MQRSDRIITLTVDAAAYGGSSIGRHKGKIIFVKGALPGETVDARVEEEAGDYSFASVVSVNKPSPERIEPLCTYFGLCGGCHLQHSSHRGQIALKEAAIKDSLKRIAKTDCDLASPLFQDNPWRYRHRGQFKVSHGEIGLYREKTRRVIRIDRCALMTDAVNDGLQGLQPMVTDSPRLFHGIAEIHISRGDCAIAHLQVLPGLKDSSEFRTLVSRLLRSGFKGVSVGSRDTCAQQHGETVMTLKLGNLGYTVSPLSFFQSHWKLNQMVVSFIANLLRPLTGKRILDIYSGAGNLSLALASEADEVIAVEENPCAVEDGERNLKMNDIRNYRFIRASAGNLDIGITPVDIIIMDPPRAGLTSRVIHAVLALVPEKILYMSCNPATLARDLKKLFAGGYALESIRMVDFFPQTYHIESLALLRRR